MKLKLIKNLLTLIILLQYIVHSQFINNFHKKIIIGSYKNIIIPVEFSLYDKLKNFLKISKFISVLFFYFYVLKSFFIGIGYFFYKSFEYLVTIFEKKNNNSNSVFFLSLFDASCIISNQDNKFNLFSSMKWCGTRMVKKKKFNKSAMVKRH